MNWYSSPCTDQTESRHRAAFLLFQNLFLPLRQRRDDGYISIFILTMPRPKIGAFFIGFGAVLLLSAKRKTDNTLSVSVLSAAILFNPKIVTQKPKFFFKKTKKIFGCSKEKYLFCTQINYLSAQIYETKRK